MDTWPPLDHYRRRVKPKCKSVRSENCPHWLFAYRAYRVGLLPDLVLGGLQRLHLVRHLRRQPLAVGLRVQQVPLQGALVLAGPVQLALEVLRLWRQRSGRTTLRGNTVLLQVTGKQLFLKLAGPLIPLHQRCLDHEMH